MKKLLCITICLLMILSAFVVPVSASEQSTIKDAVLHFDTNTVTKIWGPFQKIYCHIWEYGKDPFYHWGNKEQLCTDTDGDGSITSSDASNVLLAYAYTSTCENLTLNQTQFDYNKDGLINSADASEILAKYAELSTSK